MVLSGSPQKWVLEFRQPFGLNKKSDKNLETKKPILDRSYYDNQDPNYIINNTFAKRNIYSRHIAKGTRQADINHSMEWLASLNKEWTYISSFEWQRLEDD